MTCAADIQTRDLNILSPAGRPLLRDLSMVIDKPIAITGRNGVGKTSLLRVLGGLDESDHGEIRIRGTHSFVPQLLDTWTQPRLDWTDTGEFERAGLAQLEPTNRLSLGERRKLHLISAKQACSDLLLLDEPTQDLDEAGVAWLCGWLSERSNGLVVVSHDPRLLSCFKHFLLIQECGVRYVPGDYDTLLQHFRRQHRDSQKDFIRRLAHHKSEEEKLQRIQRRKQRKKNLGRLHEDGRNPSRAQLGAKKQYAQKSQGKAKRLRDLRLRRLREQTKGLRRAVSVSLPLSEVLKSKATSPLAYVQLDRVSMERSGRRLFTDLDLIVRKQRVALCGANGSGKSTLLDVLSGKTAPTMGKRSSHGSIGYIAQAAENWMLDQSLINCLANDFSVDELPAIVHAHQFPFALAERPLRSLSPGERIRAALIILSHQQAAPDILLLDEPTNNLDLLGTEALLEALDAWHSGLVVATHRSDIIHALGIEHVLQL